MLVFPTFPWKKHAHSELMFAWNLHRHMSSLGHRQEELASTEKKWERVTRAQSQSTVFVKGSSMHTGRILQGTDPLCYELNTVKGVAGFHTYGADQCPQDLSGPSNRPSHLHTSKV